MTNPSVAHLSTIKCHALIGHKKGLAPRLRRYCRGHQSEGALIVIYFATGARAGRLAAQARPIESPMSAEHVRLEDSREAKIPWKKWGPYLNERQWGTVREDYSEGGVAWNDFTHAHARSRAYR